MWFFWEPWGFIFCNSGMSLFSMTPGGFGFDAARRNGSDGARRFSFPHESFPIEGSPVLGLLFWIFVAANAALLIICAHIPAVFGF